jgi:hypothetical protein
MPEKRAEMSRLTDVERQRRHRTSGLCKSPLSFGATGYTVHDFATTKQVATLKPEDVDIVLARLGGTLDNFREAIQPFLDNNPLTV